MQPFSLTVTPQMVFGCHLTNSKQRLYLAALFLTPKQDGAAPGSQVRVSACVIIYACLPSGNYLGSRASLQGAFFLILEGVSISLLPALLGKQTSDTVAKKQVSQQETLSLSFLPYADQ